MSHVLIIEDEPFMAMLIEDVLREQGVDSFDIAASEGAAIDAAMSRQPDLITSDVRLTQGTGPLAVKAIHDRLGPIPVIFITGTPEECSPCDPRDVVLAKPLNHAAMADAFHRLRPAAA